MSMPPLQWRAIPGSARWGIATWAAGWVCFLVNIYWLIQDGNMVAKLGVAVSLLIYFLLRAQNWARMIALMAGALAVLFLAFLAYAIRPFSVETAILIANLFVFGLAAFFLASGETAAFFKSKMEYKENDR